MSERHTMAETDDKTASPDLSPTLARAGEIVGTALTAAETIALLLTEAQRVAAEAAADDTQDQRRHARIQEIGDLGDRIDGAVKLTGTRGPGFIAVGGVRLAELVGAADGAPALPDLISVDLSFDLARPAFDAWKRQPGDRTLLRALDQALATLVDRTAGAVAALAEAEERIGEHMEFLGALDRSLHAGLATIDTPDPIRDSANLRALRLQQDLGEAETGLAQTASRSILSLL